MLKKILKWTAMAIFAAFAVLVVARMFVLDAKERTNRQVEKIHATKLSMDDVTGKNLPPDPGADADKTIQGIDANQNGIRDDVELAIFNEYPNSAKTRAVLLQYALALQMEVTQSIVNEETVTAVAEETSRGYSCIGDAVSRDDKEKFNKVTDEYINFIENNQLNTEQRQKAQKDFYDENLGSYELKNGCDISLNALPN